jgi:hypothetical protein
VEAPLHGFVLRAPPALAYVLGVPLAHGKIGVYIEGSRNVIARNRVSHPFRGEVRVEDRRELARHPARAAVGFVGDREVEAGAVDRVVVTVGRCRAAWRP